jgi:hypothetical protein
MLSVMGIDPSAITAGLPTKLTSEHWRAILAHLPEGV